jgi:hypothetical protein
LEDRTLLAGNLLLTTEVPGQIVYNLLQYTQKGHLVSSVNIPQAPGSTEYEDARGLSLDPSGNVNIFDGTFQPSLATYAPSANSWSFQTTSGWTTVNNVSYGEVAAYNQYVFASDMVTANQPTDGIVRFGGGATTIFGQGTDFIQVALGQDGMIYGLGGSGAVQEFNPDTMAKERGFKLMGGPDSDIRSIAIDPSGTIYAATWGGYAVKYDANGHFVTSMSLNGDNLLSIALDTDGQIAIGGRFGNVYLTNESLTSVKTIQTNQWNVFVTFDHYIGTNVDQWTGANSAVDTNWTDGANWSLGAPPTAGQTALFTKNPSVKGFTATVDASSTIANLDIDISWKGTIDVNNALSVTGNFAMASGTFGGSGAVTIAGSASRWTGGQLTLGSGGFTDNGSLTINPAGRTLDLAGPGSLTNTNTILQIGTGTLSLNNATLNNASEGTYIIQDNGSIAQSGGGTLLNAGVLEKARGTGTSTIAASTLNNTGTVLVTAGTLDISATVTQISSNTLTGGSWTVKGSSGLSTLDITSGSFTTLGKGAKVELNGPLSTFTNLSGLAAIDAGASLTLAGDQSFTTAGALTNDGHLTLSPGSILTVSGNFTESSTGKLTLQMGMVGSSTEMGSLVSTTGTESLAGSLQVTATAVPAVGSSFAILDNEGNAAISGTFAGLPEGATFTVTTGGTTMTFQISYVGSDADGSQNVVLTRIS